MPGDIVVAHGRATVDGGTLFGHNSDLAAGDGMSLQLVSGRSFAAGEMVQTQFLKLPQVRDTFTVLGSQPAGYWGYEHGVNEHGVALARTSLQSKLACAGPALTGPDLVRLALERSRSALKAVDLIIDCVERHGQGRFAGCPVQLACDNAFVVADAEQAFVVEAAGQHWVFQEIQEVGAISDVSLVRQDWGRISRGLAGHAIAQGWWPADGSKLDFAGAVSEDPVGPCSALRRWGRALMMLEQQSGHIDLPFFRRLLADHYETMHSTGDCGTYTAASLVVTLGGKGSRLQPVWCAFGPPCITVYFPVFLEGELPAAFSLCGSGRVENSVAALVARLNDQLKHCPQQLPMVAEAIASLQARFDQEAEEFAKDAGALKQSGGLEELKRQAAHLMQHHLEQFQNVIDGLISREREPARMVVQP
jgi:secernin